MSVKSAIQECDGIYFICFTCQCWLPLFELTNTYDALYQWFDYLKAKGHYITGYVILTDCLHVLIGFKASIHQYCCKQRQTLCGLLIVKRLEAQNSTAVLHKLPAAVTEPEEKEESYTRCLNLPLMQRNAKPGRRRHGWNPRQH